MNRKIVLVVGVLGLFFPRTAYAVWDKTTPAGTEAKSLGDDRIREFKTDVETSLKARGDFPGPDTSDPRYIPTVSSGTSADRPSGLQNAATGMIYVNVSSNTVERFNGATWTPIASLVPSGMKMFFVGNSCPSGWSMDVSSNGYALRTTTTSSSGGSVGGSVDISTGTFAHSHTVNAHTHTTPDHQHELDHELSAASFDVDISCPVVSGNSSGAPMGRQMAGGAQIRRLWNRTANSGAGTSGSASPGTDTQSSGILKYMNVIICTAP